MSLSAPSNAQPHGVFSIQTPPLSLTIPCRLSFARSLRGPVRLHSLPPSFHSSYSVEQDDLEEHVTGDCVVFEEGVFDDPYILEEPDSDNPNAPSVKPKKGAADIRTENLVPDKWREVQAEINITKKERRKIAQELQFGTRVEKKKKGLIPLRQVNLEEYLAYKEAKLAQLKPLLLDNPTNFSEKGGGGDEKGVESSRDSEKNGASRERVPPRNPRWAVYGRGLEDVTEFFNSGSYEPADKKSEGPRKLFTKDEKVMLNKRAPDLATSTSDNWLPLHTLAASGEFYLVDALVKHNVDVNSSDKVGLTALHKAIMGKKQAITNYLLRESANPFVRDNNGATLMHYAVQTASSQAIKVLLLYGVDIDLQDNDGWTPLHLAVQARRTDVVRLLLIKGADRTLKNGTFALPANAAEAHREIQIIKKELNLLVSASVIPIRNLFSVFFCSSAKNIGGSTIGDSPLRIQQWLVQDGLTPLDLCLRSGQDTRTYELIKLLKRPPKPRKLL